MCSLLGDVEGILFVTAWPMEGERQNEKKEVQVSEIGVQGV